ncbi:hypothetical protein ABZ690_15600 [Streptomyces sp. NPDC006967]
MAGSVPDREKRSINAGSTRDARGVAAAFSRFLPASRLSPVTA